LPKQKDLVCRGETRLPINHFKIKTGIEKFPDTFSILYFILSERLLLRRFLVDPALAFGLLRLPAQQGCHHQRHQHHL